MIDLERFRRGGDQDFEHLVRTYGPLVLTVTRAHGKDIDHAEDLFQEVWKRVLEKRHTYSGSGRFEGWIRRVAVNVCIADFRARKVRAEAMVRLAELERHENPRGEYWDPLAGLEREELQVRLHRALSLITERQQEAIHLRLFEERPPEQVAKIMGVERATVRSLIRKGLNRLREISENLQG